MPWRKPSGSSSHVGREPGGEAHRDPSGAALPNDPHLAGAVCGDVDLVGVGRQGKAGAVGGNALDPGDRHDRPGRERVPVGRCREDFLCTGMKPASRR